ncbi:MAG: 1,4-dihydroxy-2-naphthoyl-CoA hydrolase [Candidatus Heimdallarchaeota archaeon LC_2]|nr:MAG: 1,4-dihydroxy-2-naphthoyl-CoA hydrolase [Candidatus Heimdallarchaeota archaeon LC_2]
MVNYQDIQNNHNPFILNVQLRLADTDNLGHLNNVAYIEFLETARTEWHAHVKESREFLDNGKWDWILGEIRIRFMKEAYLSDKLVVIMWCSRIGRKSWDFSYMMVNENEDVVVIAQTSHIAYDYGNLKSKPLPNDILKDLTLRKGDRFSEFH